MPHHPRVPLTRRALLARAAAAAWALPLLPPLGRAADHPGHAFTTHAHAWDAFVEGATLYQRYTPEANAAARERFAQALTLDPACTRAYAMVAATHRQDGNQAWTEDRARSERLAADWARTAVSLARLEPAPTPSLPYALEQWAWVLLYQDHDHGAALAAAREAVALQPTFANGHALEAHILTYMGEPEAALRKTADAVRLDPTAVLHHAYHRGHAYYVWGARTLERDADAARPYYAQATTSFREALRRNHHYRPARSFLVAALWELGRWEPGRTAEAQHEMAILRDTGRPQASENLHRFQDYVRRGNPYTDPAMTARLMAIWQAAETPAGGAA
jgi:adenylate cyclase